MRITRPSLSSFEPRAWWRNRSVLRLAVFFHDSLWILLSVPLALIVRVDWRHLADLSLESRWWVYLGVTFLCQSLSLYALKCYRGIWRFASLPDLIRLTEAVALGTLLTLGSITFIDDLERLPRGFLILQPLLLLIGLGAGRLGYRIWKERRGLFFQRTGQRAVLVGAGVAAELLLRDLRDDRTYVPVAFVDDDPAKRGRALQGVPVLGTVNELSRVIQEVRAQIVIYAMPSAPRRLLQQVVQTCQTLQVTCWTLPRLSELINQRITVERLRPVSVEDLLGREPVVMQSSALQNFFGGKRILVTGAGGSIGSEICRQLLSLGVDRLILVEHAEYNLYRILAELNPLAGARIEGRLTDVTSAEAMDGVFRETHPEVVFHAAAYKHVPLVEENPVAGIRNNVFGTKNMAEMAIRHSVERFMLVSTDKAVWPANIMGATKRLAEQIVLALNGQGRTEFMTVRFGNVLDSMGSVVPLFRAQIKAGGPVTVTHPEVRRYFMTISEAVHLVLEAATSRLGAGIFVLDMGKPIRIRDLAEQMVELSGHRLGIDMEIVYIGLRPGEKLAEQLFYEQERRLMTDHPKLFLAQSETHSDWASLKRDLELWSARLMLATRPELIGELNRLTHGDFRRTEPREEETGRGVVIPLVANRIPSHREN